MKPKRRVRGLFVTGTDTGVGKTLIACALAAWAHRCGLDVGVMKPIATGGHRLDGRWVSEDAVHLVRAAGSADPWRLINPVCFREPLAPWTAARRARRPIQLPAILTAFGQLAARHDVVIVEGIGGLLVPLTERLTVADLAARMALPIVVVARPGLGTLNHTLLTLEEARRRGMPVRAVVLNHAEPPPRGPMARLAEATNPAALKRLARLPVFGPLPFHRGAGKNLAGWIERGLGESTLASILT